MNLPLKSIGTKRLFTVMDEKNNILHCQRFRMICAGPTYLGHESVNEAETERKHTGPWFACITYIQGTNLLKTHINYAKKIA